jgi:transposase
MRMQNAEVDFNGQTVYVGIDVGKKSWKVCVIIYDREHKVFSQDPSGSVLGIYLRSHFPGAQYSCVYEAGCFGFAPHASLIDAGLACIVVNPGDVPTKDKERVTKTDRIDARKLAWGLAKQELVGIYVPSRAEQEARSLVRTRHVLVQKQTRCKNQIKSILAYYGIRTPEDCEGRSWPIRFIEWLEREQLTTRWGTTALRSRVKELAFLRGEIAEIKKDILLLGEDPVYRESLALIQSVPGIGAMTGMVLLTELVDMKRFHDDGALACYVGLVPGERSSGESTRHTGITRRRNTWLRHVMIEAAWIASAKDPALIKANAELRKRMSGSEATVRIARKLLMRVKHVLVHRVPYRPMMVN